MSGIEVVTCSTISNITARNEEQIQAIIEANIIAPLVHLLQNAEFDIKEQAAKAISNATSGGTHDQIRFLVSQGCIKQLCDLLCYFDPEVFTVCLQGLENILKKVERISSIVAEGRENIKHCQYYNGTENYEKAMEVLKTYWYYN
ncbi:hypothetical protein GOBAR_AA23747 [Gossypium barbadense]|uniref:Armadillo repeat-containing domain-containing protein n=1 Tax=Gossypium barbadense TaxID=3634 RepID=A0A2P5X0T9_GOSBA|nr:hypothetical protein GOBAR_AA23747 [Gossypium barbadense]